MHCGPAHPAVLAVELVHLVLEVLAAGAHPAAPLALAHLLWKENIFQGLGNIFKILNREIPWQRRCRRARSISTWGGRWHGRRVGSSTRACRGPRPRWRQIHPSWASHSTFQLSRMTTIMSRESENTFCFPRPPAVPARHTQCIMLPSQSAHIVQLNTIWEQEAVNSWQTNSVGVVCCHNGC